MTEEMAADDVEHSRSSPSCRLASHHLYRMAANVGVAAIGNDVDQQGGAHMQQQIQQQVQDMQANNLQHQQQMLQHQQQHEQQQQRHLQQHQGFAQQQQQMVQLQAQALQQLVQIVDDFDPAAQVDLRVMAARGYNATRTPSEQLAPVPCSAANHQNFGVVPANVPTTLFQLQRLPAQVAGQILVEYGQPAGPPETRRRRLAGILGVRY